MFSIAGFKPGPCFSEYDHTNKCSCLQKLELHCAPRQSKQTPFSIPPFIYCQGRLPISSCLNMHKRRLWGALMFEHLPRVVIEGVVDSTAELLGQVVRGTKEMANRPL